VIGWLWENRPLANGCTRIRKSVQPELMVLNAQSIQAHCACPKLNYLFGLTWYPVVSYPMRTSVLLTMCVWVVCLRAQDLVLRQLSEEQGLPSNCVFDLHMDSEGLLWVATNKGLYRYDGFSFEPIGKGTPLEQAWVVGMVEGREPGDFFFSASGFHLFRYEKGVVSEWVNNDPMAPHADAGAYNNMCLDTTGGLLVSGNNCMGIFRVDLRSRTFSEFGQEGPFSRVWMAYGTPAGCRYSTPTGRDSLLVDLPGLRRCFPIIRRNPLGRGVTVASLRSGAVAVYQNDLLVLLDQERHWVERRFGNTVVGVMEDAQGRYWVRVFDEGVYCLDHDLQDVSDLRRPFTTSQVTDAVQDDQGGIWFSTIDKGLFYCANPRVKCYRSQTVFGVPYLTALAMDTAGRPYVAASDGTVFRLDSGKTVRPIVRREERSTRSEVKALIVDREGRIWPGNPWQVYDVAKEHLLSMGAHTPSSSAGYDLQHLSDGRWLFANHGSLSLFDAALQDTLRTAGKDMRFTRLCPTGVADEFWVTTSSGLYRYANEHIARVAPADTMLGLRMYDVLPVRDTLWLATDKGVVLTCAGRSYALRSREEDWGTSVRDLELTEGRWVWCATLNGLLRYDRHDPLAAPLRVDRSHGLPSNVVYKVAGYQDRVWCIAGPDLCTFNPSELQMDRALPDLRVLGVRAHNGFTPTGEERTFDHTVDHISVDLRHVYYGRFLGPAFRYRQSDRAAWSTTEKPTLELVGLKPGSYQLEIQAADGNGGWVPSVFTAWRIAPPFKDTGWFYGLVVIGAILGTALLVAWRTSQRRREATLEAEARHYHHRALLAQMEPHFLFNALNTIQGFVVQNDVESSTRYLARFAKLMRGLLQASEKEEVTLREEIDLLENYCSLEALRSEPPFSYRISVAEGLDPQLIGIPAFLVQPYVENAIRHGLRHLQNGGPGVLLIAFTDLGIERLRCTVEDNGIGRALAGKLKEQGNAFVSQGTRINAERLRILEERAGQGRYAVRTEDLIDPTGSACGTRVVLDMWLPQRSSASN
jgi:ligand-binding sensor domain-containing protein